MAEAFARHTKGNAHIVIVGRNRAAGDRRRPSPRSPNPRSPEQSTSLSNDVTLMRNVHRVADDFLACMPKTTDGRNETEEGIDRRLAVHYYGRWKFIKDLLPALENAHGAGEDAKVMSVLAAGRGGEINLEDLGLKNSFTWKTAATTATTYNDIMVNRAIQGSYPGFVASSLYKSSNSNLLNAINVLMPLFSPFAYSVEASGEHQLFALLKTGPGAARTGPNGDGIGLTQGTSARQRG
ncbi:hypothetical protein DFH06DRAFT_1475972 [Mycena polygramma]|nr:hypothetical protein DFH06DRAFT_1475972 [Mycena polygramma]